MTPTTPGVTAATSASTEEDDRPRPALQLHRVVDVATIECEAFGQLALPLPDGPDDGAARRRLTLLRGQCVCGARLDLAAAAAGRVAIEHEWPCPATDLVEAA